MTEITIYLEPDDEYENHARIYVDWREGEADLICLEFHEDALLVSFNGHTVAKRYHDDPDPEPQDLDDDEPEQEDERGDPFDDPERLG